MGRYKDVSFQYAVWPFGTDGYSEWGVYCRTYREAIWVARRLAISMFKRFQGAKGDFRPTVKIDCHYGSRYSKQARGVPTEWLLKVQCLRGTELEIVLWFEVSDVAQSICSMWAAESPDNSYKIIDNRLNGEASLKSIDRRRQRTGGSQ